MSRPEITKWLSELTEKLINPNNDSRMYWAREVTFDYATSNRVRVDYMKFEPLNTTVSGIEKGDFYCYEIKSSAEDFHSKNGHNFIGDYNYYVMSSEVYQKVSAEIPFSVGVYCPSGGTLESVKQARRMNRKRSVTEMLLMMFRSANRDRLKSSDKIVKEERMDRINCEKCLNSEFYDGDKLRCKLIRCNPRYEDTEETMRDLVGSFPGSYINNSYEFILGSIGFSLRGCWYQEDVDCKVLEWLSGAASEDLYILQGINKYFCFTDFSKDDMREIYTYLGNACNHQKTLEFIKSNYDMDVLKR